jgi:hypothetical protein
VVIFTYTWYFHKWYDDEKGKEERREIQYQAALNYCGGY